MTPQQFFFCHFGALTDPFGNFYWEHTFGVITSNNDCIWYTYTGWSFYYALRLYLFVFVISTVILIMYRLELHMLHCSFNTCRIVLALIKFSFNHRYCQFFIDITIIRRKMLINQPYRRSPRVEKKAVPNQWKLIIQARMMWRKRYLGPIWHSD